MQQKHTIKLGSNNAKNLKRSHRGRKVSHKHQALKMTTTLKKLQSGAGWGDKFSKLGQAIKGTVYRGPSGAGASSLEISKKQLCNMIYYNRGTILSRKELSTFLKEKGLKKTFKYDKKEIIKNYYLVTLSGQLLLINKTKFLKPELDINSGSNSSSAENTNSDSSEDEEESSSSESQNGSSENESSSSKKNGTEINKKLNYKLREYEVYEMIIINQGPQSIPVFVKLSTKKDSNKKIFVLSSAKWKKFLNYTLVIKDRAELYSELTEGARGYETEGTEGEEEGEGLRSPPGHGARMRSRSAERTSRRGVTFAGNLNQGARTDSPPRFGEGARGRAAGARGRAAGARGRATSNRERMSENEFGFHRMNRIYGQSEEIQPVEERQPRGMNRDFQTKIQMAINIDEQTEQNYSEVEDNKVAADNALDELNTHFESVNNPKPQEAKDAKTHATNAKKAARDALQQALRVKKEIITQGKIVERERSSREDRITAADLIIAAHQELENYRKMCLAQKLLVEANRDVVILHEYLETPTDIHDKANTANTALQAQIRQVNDDVTQARTTEQRLQADHTAAQGATATAQTNYDGLKQDTNTALTNLTTPGNINNIVIGNGLVNNLNVALAAERAAADATAAGALTGATNAAAQALIQDIRGQFNAVAANLLQALTDAITAERAAQGALFQAQTYEATANTNLQPGTAQLQQATQTQTTEGPKHTQAQQEITTVLQVSQQLVQQITQLIQNIIQNYINPGTLQFNANPNDFSNLEIFKTSIETQLSAIMRQYDARLQQVTQLLDTARTSFGQLAPRIVIPQ